MSLLSVIIAIVIVGVLLYVINKYVPMEAQIKNLLNIVVIILLVIWIMNALGAFNYLRGIKV